MKPKNQIQSFIVSKSINIITESELVTIFHKHFQMVAYVRFATKNEKKNKKGRNKILYSQNQYLKTFNW